MVISSFQPLWLAFGLSLALNALIKKLSIKKLCDVGKVFSVHVVLKMLAGLSYF